MVQMEKMEDRMSSFELSQADLQKELSEKSKQCKSLERKLKSAQKKLDYANEQLFGDKCQKVKLKTPKVKSDNTDPDRRKEKER